MCKFSLYVKTKILIRLNIFDQEDFWKTYEILMENLCKTHGRLMEDFDLGGKRNLKFYLNLDGMRRKTSF